MGVDGQQAAKDFATELGLNDSAWQDLLVRKVDTQDIEYDNGMKVPTNVKQLWKKWCRHHHPDKRGDTEAFTRMNQRYDHFKTWFQAHQDDVSGTSKGIARANALAEKKKQGDEAMEAAKKARLEERYQEAEEQATRAIKAYEEYARLRAEKLCSKPKVGEEIQKAKELFDTIQRQANEHKLSQEREDRCRQEHAELQDGLDALLKDVGLDVKALAIPERFTSLKRWIEDLQGMVEALENEKEDLQTRMSAMDQELLKLKDENVNLTTHLHEAEQAADADMEGEEEHAADGTVLSISATARQAVVETARHCVGHIVSGFRRALIPQNAARDERSLSSKIARLHKERASLTEALREKEKTLGHLECMCRENAQNVKEQQDEQKRLEENISRLEHQLAGMEELMPQIENKMERRLDQLDHSEHDMRTQLDRTTLDRDAGEPKTKVTDLEAKVTDLEAKVTDLEAKVTDLEAKLEKARMHLKHLIQAKREARKQEDEQFDAMQTDLEAA